MFYVVMAFSRSLRKDFKRSLTFLIKLLNLSNQILFLLFQCLSGEMWTGHLGVLFLLATSFVLQAESRKSRKYGKKCKKIMKFLHVSDIHLDPFYNQSMDKDTYCHNANGSETTADYKAPYGRIGCDSPEWLWESTLRAMKSKGADFMLLTGTKRKRIYVLLDGMSIYSMRH